MALVKSIAGPTVQGVVQNHARYQLVQIVAELARQSNRQGQQASGLWGQIMAVGVGGADHKGHAVQRIGFQAEQGQERVKGAQIADMGIKLIDDPSMTDEQIAFVFISIGEMTQILSKPI